MKILPGQIWKRAWNLELYYIEIISVKDDYCKFGYCKKRNTDNVLRQSDETWDKPSNTLLDHFILVTKLHKVLE